MSDALLSVLREPGSALPYSMTVALAEAHPDAYVLESEDPIFDVETFLADHAVELRPDANVTVQHSTWFGPPPNPFRPMFAPPTTGAASRRLEVGTLRFAWQGASYELVALRYLGDFRERRRRYLVADDRPKAEAFFEAVCAHNAEVRDEILVFAHGCWSKSKRLYEAVKGASLDDLVLAEGLVDRIVGDFRRFLGAAEEYAHYRIPYKRGALFVGPPGNGKTLCIKALIGELSLPCLYVQSFVAPQTTPQSNISAVFDRARRSAPCLLVLEDLDTLVDAQSLSFFLNQLDGFDSNDGLVTLASTNHPERLDPALLQRPSRFDRKYHFELPDAAERGRYIERWNERLVDELRLAEEDREAVVRATDGYSYAYLKELFVASLMRWTADRERSFGAIALDEATALAEQMKTGGVVPEIGQTFVDESPLY